MSENKVINKIQPLGERILLERVVPPEKIGLIFIPPKARERLMRWKIVALGDLVDNYLTKFKVGEIVLCSWYIGMDVQMIDEDIPESTYKIVMPENIVGRWRG